MTDAELDRLLGIRTDLSDYTWRGDVHPCQPSPVEVSAWVAARLGAEDIIADLGSGVGRAVFALALLSPCRVIGAELDPSRHAVAEDNLRRCAARRPDVAARVHLVHGAAQDIDWHGEGVTAFYAFNPFPARILRGVLRRTDPGRMPDFYLYYADDTWRDVLAEYGYRCTEEYRLLLRRDPRERTEHWKCNL